MIPALVFKPSGVSVGKAYAQIPSPAFELDFVRNTTATRVNKDFIFEQVTNDILRLTYFYSGEFRTCPAALVEDARTNRIRNNTMVGAVVGIPGTLPTHWSSSLGGLNQQIVGTQVLNSINIIDIRFFGTATVVQLDYRFEATMQIPALVGQTWTASLYYAVLNQPLPPNNFQTQMVERNSAGTSVAYQAVSIIPTSSLVRYSQTRTLTAATTAFVQHQFRHALTIGQSYDFTIRIGLPQMELGSVATSPIPTSGSIATRNADLLFKTGIAARIGQVEGTILVDCNLDNTDTTLRTIFGVSDTTTGNRISIRKTTDNRIQLVVTNSSSATVSIQTPTNQFGRFRIVVSYEVDNVFMYVNGTFIGNDNSTAIPACSAAYFGCREDGTANDMLNDTLHEVRTFLNKCTLTQAEELSSTNTYEELAENLNYTI